MEDNENKSKKFKNNASKLIRLPRKILMEIKSISKKLKISSSRFVREAIMEEIKRYREDEK